MSTPTELLALLDATDDLPWAVELRERTYELLRLPPGARVADIGCGAGRAVAELSERGAHVTGIDPAEEMLAAARERRPDLDFVAGTAGDLPFADGELAGYRADKVYHVLPDPGAALAEARRVLRPGGRIVLVGQDWESFMIDSGDPALTRELVLARAATIAHPRVARGYRNMLLDHEFEDVTVEAHTQVSTDAAGFQLLANIARKGAVDPGRVTDWLAEQARRAEEGRLFLAVPMFLAAGTRP